MNVEERTGEQDVFEGSLRALVEAEEEIMRVYPCVVAPTRYGGTYEGGLWAAFKARAIPDDADGSDIECASWWAAPTCLVGVGGSPNEAYRALVKVVANCAHPDKTVLKLLDRYGEPIELCGWCLKRTNAPDEDPPGGREVLA